MAYVHGKTYYIIPEGAVSNRSNVLIKNERPVALNLAGLTPVEGYTNNRNVNLWAIDYTTDMKWYLEVPRNAGYARFHCRGKPTYGLDYYYGSSNPGNCDIYKIAGNEEDSKINFRTVSAGENRYRIQCYRNNADNDLYLTATGFSNGSDVRWQPLDYSKNSQQIWWLVPIEDVMRPNQIKKDIIDNVYTTFGAYFPLNDTFVNNAVTQEIAIATTSFTTNNAYITARLKYRGTLSTPSFADKVTFTMSRDEEGGITISNSTQNISLSTELDPYLPENMKLEDIVHKLGIDIGLGEVTISVSTDASLKDQSIEIVHNILSHPDNPYLATSVSVVITLDIEFKNTSNYSFKKIGFANATVLGTAMIAFFTVALTIGFLTNPALGMEALFASATFAPMVTQH